MEDDCNLAMEALSDVLGRRSQAVTRDEVMAKLLELHELNGQDGDGDDIQVMLEYSGALPYHPYRKINNVVAHFANLEKNRNPYTSSKDVLTEDSDEDEDEMAEQVGDVIKDEEKAEIIKALISIYPDVDPKYLKQTCENQHYVSEDIEKFLEEKISTIPENRQIKAIVRATLENTVSPGPGTELLWCCPQCDTCRMIERPQPQESVKCLELTNCGSFCFNCNRRTHRPFKCRAKNERVDAIENQVDIFRKLRCKPSEDLGPAKIFKMTPQNNLNFSDPLHILYLAAEGTFLRMMDSSGDPNFSARKSIKAIKYIENEKLREAFESCKSRFLAEGVPNGERLVFHGTSADIKSIVNQNLLLSRCTRFAHGHGIYFSEFPSVSERYGQHLLLCRVMLGNPYQGEEHKIPVQYNSKLVSPDQQGKAGMIIIDKENQILPAFIVELKR